MVKWAAVGEWRSSRLHEELANDGTEAQKWLGGRRSAGSTMQSKGIRLRSVNGRRSTPRHLLGFRKQGDRSTGQGRHVQGLADVARGVGTGGVMMEGRAARGKK